METKFTPGPWSINGNIGRKSELGIVADSAPCIIAILGNQKHWPVEAAANAKLISAAPELLEALENIRCNLTGKDYLQERIASSLRYAKEAIAKATE